MTFAALYLLSSIAIFVLVACTYGLDHAPKHYSSRLLVRTVKHYVDPVIRIGGREFRDSIEVGPYMFEESAPFTAEQHTFVMNRHQRRAAAAKDRRK